MLTNIENVAKYFLDFKKYCKTIICLQNLCRYRRKRIKVGNFSQMLPTRKSNFDLRRTLEYYSGPRARSEPYLSRPAQPFELKYEVIFPTRLHVGPERKQLRRWTIRKYPVALPFWFFPRSFRRLALGFSFFFETYKFCTRLHFWNPVWRPRVRTAPNSKM